MKISDRIARAASLTGASLKTLVKVALQSRPVALSPAGDPARLLIMGNGPSLRSEIDTHLSELASSTTMAVNFAANAPEFTDLKPRYYLLADPHFFSAGNDANVDRLRSRLREVTWPMTLFTPRGTSIPGLPENVTTEHFNMVGASGFRKLVRWLYGRRLAMARPRNVLIPALMIGVWLGFREIYILGADHSWLRTLDVTDDNVVVSVQPHFYKEDPREQQRVSSVYRDVRLHEILGSFAVAFAAYHDIAPWARERGTAIYNATPGSYIDAFERRRPF